MISSQQIYCLHWKDAAKPFKPTYDSRTLSKAVRRNVELKGKMMEFTQVEYFLYFYQWIYCFLWKRFCGICGKCAHSSFRAQSILLISPGRSEKLCVFTNPYCWCSPALDRAVQLQPSDFRGLYCPPAIEATWREELVTKKKQEKGGWV